MTQTAARFRGARAATRPTHVRRSPSHTLRRSVTPVDRGDSLSDSSTQQGDRQYPLRTRFTMSPFLSCVRDALTKMAIERAPSVRDYMDENLGAILGRESAARLLREILEDRQVLESVAHESYTHGNGFDKITLISSDSPEFKLRLHAWWLKEEYSESKELIHNHRWFFTSSILRGAAHVEIFEDDGQGELMWRHDYSPRDDADEKYQLQPAGVGRLTSNLTLKLTPGSVYSMSGDALHRVLWVGNTLSITMFVRWGRFGLPQVYSRLPNTWMRSFCQFLHSHRQKHESSLRDS